jgi:hypothetical protein
MALRWTAATTLAVGLALALAASAAAGGFATLASARFPTARRPGGRGT